MRQTAAEAGVQIVTGDTKVVERGSADKLFINTSGVGLMPENVTLSMSLIHAGDQIIVSGAIADHGIAVLSCREGLAFETDIVSDCAPLSSLIESILPFSDGLKFMRDPTRGGLATTLKEIAERTHLGIIVEEKRIPIRPGVSAACELLGLDPIYIANEGKVIIVAQKDVASQVCDTLRNHPLGKESRIIGSICAEHPGQVHLKTSIGGTRLVDMLVADQQPRIC